MADNRETLERLFESGAIDLDRGALFDEAPLALPDDLDFGRVRGMMLGLAIGDALGNTSESLAPDHRRVVCGEVRDYLPNPFAGGARVGLPSDDTQLAFWTLEQMLADGALVRPGTWRGASPRGASTASARRSRASSPPTAPGGRGSTAGRARRATAR